MQERGGCKGVLQAAAPEPEPLNTESANSLNCPDTRQSRCSELYKRTP